MATKFAASTLTKETIIVNKPVQGKFGPQVLVGEKDYYSFGRGYNGAALVAGLTYDVDVEVTAKGYKYIVGAILVGQTQTATVINSERQATPAQAAKAHGYSKDARILPQGVWQAAIQAPALAALAGDSDTLIKLANEIALAGMAFVRANS